MKGELREMNDSFYKEYRFDIETEKRERKTEPGVKEVERGWRKK